MFPGGQGPLVAAHPEKLLWKRTICRHVRVRRSLHKQESPCFHICPLHISGQAVDLLCLVEPQRQSRGGTWGVWTTARNHGELAFPARFQNRANGGRDWTRCFIPATRIIRQSRDNFPPNFACSAPYVIIETAPHRDPLADLLNSGGRWRFVRKTKRPWK